MKAAIVLAVAGVAVAQLPDLSTVPQCALTCLIPAVGKIGCPLTDIKCSCDKADELKKEVEPCLKSGCSEEDYKKAVGLSDTLCGPSGGSSSAPASPSGGAGSSTSAPATTTSGATGSSTKTGSSTPVVTSSASSGASSSGAATTTAHGGANTTTHGGSSTTTTPATAGAVGQAAGLLAALGAAVLAL
ncbi:hypothetical protein PWT90_06596 [Aphanocladium album]|nr:hypothetical protein PWT90_06596 [Aphanocladium album]